jgi:hypothetical protein
MSAVSFSNDGTYTDKSGKKFEAQITGYGLDGKLPPEWIGQSFKAPPSITSVPESGEVTDPHGTTWKVIHEDHMIKIHSPRVPVSGVSTIGASIGGESKKVSVVEAKGFARSKKHPSGFPIVRPVYDILANIGTSKTGKILRFIRGICDAKFLPVNAEDSGAKHSFTPHEAKAEEKKAEKKNEAKAEEKK